MAQFSLKIATFSRGFAETYLDIDVDEAPLQTETSRQRQARPVARQTTDPVPLIVLVIQLRLENVENSPTHPTYDEETSNFLF